MKEFFNRNPLKFSQLGKVKGLPENTLESIDRAYNEGADAVTLYFRLSSDMKLVSVPEANLKKYTGSDQTVSRLPADTITSLDAAFMSHPDEGYPYRGKGYRFFTIEDLLDRFENSLFNIFLMGKTVRTAAVLSDVVKRKKCADRVMVSSNNSAVIRHVRKSLPEAATSFSINELVIYYAMFRTGLLSFRKNFSGDAIITTEFIGTSHIANQGLIASAAERNIRVYVRGIQSSKQAEDLRLSGADGFITEDLACLKGIAQLLKEDAGS